MIVCHCHYVSDRVIRGALAGGARTEDEIGAACAAGTGCGGCAETLRDLLESHAAAQGWVSAGAGAAAR